MQRRWNAVLLSLIPGLGHFYLGYPGKALFWFLLALIAIITQSAGFILLVWVICMVAAWSLGKRTLMAEDLQAIRQKVEGA